MVKPIWEKPRPKGMAVHHMSAVQKSAAAKIAKSHGTKVGFADRIQAMKKK